MSSVMNSTGFVQGLPTSEALKFGQFVLDLMNAAIWREPWSAHVYFDPALSRITLESFRDPVVFATINDNLAIKAPHGR
jgi:hypothetical protein